MTYEEMLAAALSKIQYDDKEVPYHPVSQPDLVFPAIVYAQVGSTALNTLRSGALFPSISIDIRAKTYGECIKIAKSVLAALRSARILSTVNSIVDLYDEDAKVKRRVLTVRLR